MTALPRLKVPATSARPGRRVAAIMLAVLGLSAGTLAAAGAARATDAPRASYIDVLNDVMCVVCHEPLAVSQSPEAFQERQYIRTLIAQGETKQQIERNLVAQYGPAVLSRPPANGVSLLVYIIPPLVLIAGLATLAIFLPRWRRRARQGEGGGAGPTRSAAPLDPADAKRLNDDLGRFA